MNRQQLRRMIFWFLTVMLLPACTMPSLAVTSPTQAAQVLAPEQLGTPIALTLAAAQTQTVVNAPSTLTPTVTSLPTWTPVILTSTPTFIFALPTFTPLPTWTSTPGVIIQVPGGGSGGSSGGGDESDNPFTGKEWTCAIRGKSPPMGTVVAQGASFYVSITLMNTGTRTWPHNSVDFIYQSGLRIEGKKIQDLPRTIAPGKEITLESLLVAPKQPGTYSTIWTLKVGNNPFCGVKYSFEVK